MNDCVIGFFAAVACAASMAADAACDAPAVLFPGQVVAERNPRIEWTVAPGATGYRVRLLSRVPDGRILASHDTVVASNAFLAPQPLAEQRAKVTLRINAICGAEAGAETVSTFAIDTAPGCVLGELSAAGAAGKADLKWKRVEGAASYEVRAFALDGRLLSATETRAEQTQLDLHGRSAIVSVRPACAGGLGEAVYRTVAAD